MIEEILKRVKKGQLHSWQNGEFSYVMSYEKTERRFQVSDTKTTEVVLLGTPSRTTKFLRANGYKWG